MQEEAAVPRRLFQVKINDVQEVGDSNAPSAVHTPTPSNAMPTHTRRKDDHPVTAHLCDHPDTCIAEEPDK